jgi:type III pantothenate kinase
MLVVDVGNSLIKWGRCADGAVTAMAALPHDDVAAWEGQLRAWDLAGPLRWVVTGVHPQTRDRLIDWLRQRGDAVDLIDAADQLPLHVPLADPDGVGIDRLLNAVAANRRRVPGGPAVIVAAGTAVVVDWVDAAGAFRGGAILPGLRLMARALHEHTALLPLIDIPREEPPLPGASTVAAMAAGVFWAAAGGAQAVIRQLLRADGAAAAPATVFLTGGDAPLLESALRSWLPEVSARPPTLVPWPLMTLEGIRLAAEALA